MDELMGDIKWCAGVSIFISYWLMIGVDNNGDLSYEVSYNVRATKIKSKKIGYK